MRRILSTMASTSSARRFAPLKQHLKGPSSDAPVLKGVVFDMDGTLCIPQTYMFGQMREALGIDKSVDILEHIESLPPAEQSTAHKAIQAVESEAMKTQAPQPGLQSLMDFLDGHNIRKAICTRNFDLPVQNLITNFMPNSVFEPIVTRDFKPPKPDPAGILHIARTWGLVDNGEAGDASGLIMVGDSVDDMTSGRKAGAATVLLVNDVNRHLVDHHHTDLVIESLDELAKVLEEGFQGRQFEVPQ